MNTPMLPGNSYTDSQGTSFAVTNSPDPSYGALFVSVVGRKYFGDVPCDAARINDGFFQANLTGTSLWLQMTFAPIRSKFVPA